MMKSVVVYSAVALERFCRPAQLQPTPGPAFVAAAPGADTATPALFPYREPEPSTPIEPRVEVHRQILILRGNTDAGHGELM
jgi:hypothetical protein